MDRRTKQSAERHQSSKHLAHSESCPRQVPVVPGADAGRRRMCGPPPAVAHCGALLRHARGVQERVHVPVSVRLGLDLERTVRRNARVIVCQARHLRGMAGG